MRPPLREPYSIEVPPLGEDKIESVNEEWMSGQDPWLWLRLFARLLS